MAQSNNKRSSSLLFHYIPNSIIFISLIIILIILSTSHKQLAFAAHTRRHFCQTSNDCNEDQCCVDTPIGRKLCLNYEQQGEACFFRFRTPTCGCAHGLKCVSTSPMQPGDWDHDYVCAKVRPFQYHKLMPYFEDINDIQYFK